MNIIQVERERQNITVEEMADLANMDIEDYIESEITCGFTVQDYLKICSILNIDLNTHI